MAVKSILGEGYKMEDLFSMYEDLASGKLKEANVGKVEKFENTASWWQNAERMQKIGESPLMANAENIGSILGKSAELEAYKTRRKQQTNLQAQGVGRTQSILGGSVI